MTEMYHKYGEAFTIPLLHKKMTFLIGPHVSPHFYNATDDKMSQKEVGWCCCSCCWFPTSSNRGAGCSHGVQPSLLAAAHGQHPWKLCRLLLSPGRLPPARPRQVYNFNVPTFGRGVVYDVDQRVRSEQFRWVADALRTAKLRTYVPAFKMVRRQRRLAGALLSWEQPGRCSKRGSVVVCRRRSSTSRSGGTRARWTSCRPSPTSSSSQPHARCWVRGRRSLPLLPARALPSLLLRAHPCLPAALCLSPSRHGATSLCLAAGREIRESMFREVADLYHDLDDGMRPISVIFPYLPTAYHRRRDAAREALRGIFKKVIASRRASGSKEDDILQVGLRSVVCGRGCRGRQPTPPSPAQLLPANKASHDTSSCCRLPVPPRS